MPAVGAFSRAVVEAFAPAHVTGVFSPAAVSRDPRGRGSIGAGVVLDAGVRARVALAPARRPAVVVRAVPRGPMPISEETAVRLLGDRPFALTVHLLHDVPIGQGFGTSAAGALATALAVARLLDLPRARAIEVAHLADLFGGGGLGGVAAILGGGLEVRERPGIPPRGRIRHLPFPRPVLLGVTGRPIPSPRLLTDAVFLDRVRAASAGALDRLGARPTPAAFLAEAERFTDEMGFAPAPLARLIRGLRSDGARAAQAMFGHSFFAVPRGPASRRAVLRRLSRAGVRTVELGASPMGARVVAETARERLLPRTRLGRSP